VPAGISGPAVLRVSFMMKQKVTIGLVLNAEAGNYQGVSEFMNALEQAICANSGDRIVKLSCDLSDADQDMTIMVGEMRDPAQATKDVLGAQKQVEAVGLGGPIDENARFGVAPKN
jgi:hypothetical protein